MLFFMGAEAKFINKIYNFTKIMSTLDFVFEFAEYFTDFIFNGVGAIGRDFDFS